MILHSRASASTASLSQPSICPKNISLRRSFRAATWTGQRNPRLFHWHRMPRFRCPVISGQVDIVAQQSDTLDALIETDDLSSPESDADADRGTGNAEDIDISPIAQDVNY